MKININNASVKDLQQIPGIGPILAQRIVEFRGKNGINSREDLLNVKGLSRSKICKIRRYISFKDPFINNIKNTFIDQYYFVYDTIHDQVLMKASRKVSKKLKKITIRNIAITVSILSYFLSPLLFLVSLYYAYGYKPGYAFLPYMLAAYLWGIAKQKNGSVSFLTSLITIWLYFHKSLNPLCLIIGIPAILVMTKAGKRARMFEHDLDFEKNLSKQPEQSAKEGI